MMKHAWQNVDAGANLPERPNAISVQAVVVRYQKQFST